MRNLRMVLPQGANPGPALRAGRGKSLFLIFFGSLLFYGQKPRLRLVERGE
jgi:hypothetical protein